MCVRDIRVCAAWGRLTSLFGEKLPIAYTYNYIEKKLNTVYPMYKPTLENSKN